MAQTHQTDRLDAIVQVDYCNSHENRYNEHVYRMTHELVRSQYFEKVITKLIFCISFKLL